MKPQYSAYFIETGFTNSSSNSLAFYLSNISIISNNLLGTCFLLLGFCPMAAELVPGKADH